PLDENAPLGRQAFMLEDCGARLVVTELGRQTPEGIERVELDGAGRLDAGGEDLKLPLSSEAAAYVMYTSGSTGQPEGVEVPHGALGRLLVENGYAKLERAAGVALVSNPAFDASVLEIWGPLATGGRIVVVDR